ncbi:hypothetical protein GOP47_0023910 [Adiantum capillus-veneris]|uniref:Uncharacterized protein n=1 Tax=Adiantum capillus-veneris TaxID=13818 RepID=A0A9D4Z513_ADICA|nr:hypothetical protein GOP47_0023910 [Adiantum capillus-veneris]
MDKKYDGETRLGGLRGTKCRDRGAVWMKRHLARMEKTCTMSDAGEPEEDYKGENTKLEELWMKHHLTRMDKAFHPQLLELGTFLADVRLLPTCYGVYDGDLCRRSPHFFGGDSTF